MAHKDPEKVLVAGAGIAGLTSALSLVCAGHEVSVFEKTPVLETVGAGIQISPNAWKILSRLGDVTDLEKVASFPKSIRIFNGHTGTKLSDLPLGEDFARRFGAPYSVIHRGDLQNVLLRWLNRNAGIDVQLNRHVVGYDAAGETAALLFSDGTRETGSMVVAADGIWSKLRGQVSGLPAPIYTGKMAWRTVIPAEQITDVSLLEHTSVWLASASHTVAYPVHSGKALNIVVIISQSPDTNSERPEFGNWATGLSQLLKSAQEWGRWPIHSVPKPYCLQQNRLAVIGDAAHAMLPFAAQGAAMAIEDAAVLSAAVDNAPTINEALQKYSQLRMTRLEKVAALAHSNGQIYHLPAPASYFRDIAMRILPHSRLMERQAWVYGWELPV